MAIGPAAPIGRSYFGSGSVQLDAFLAMLSVPRPWLAVFPLDLFPVFTVVVVMIDLAMLGWILRGISVIG
jgi:hypothetical protein